ncbi:hypothetical protein CYMTET_56251 [Cymbomonas tetramitiformis]|uniref:Uncharacterized protein n=1 Tax=Cymbomonas tetramitiformis TaxID=36881 RepID=A0AAE0BCJ1_9CHLO|nr:hypothetical protein CYMTET_56251 [Cymbomonas tetramitiformis]
MASRQSARSKRRPDRFENDGDDKLLQQAIQNSLATTQRIEREIPEAPVLRPSPEEFKEPLKYIAKQTELGARYGIIKIIPPEGYKPEFALQDSQMFKTRKQNTHRLMEGQPYGEGGRYTMAQYREQADAFQQKWMSGHPRILEEAHRLQADLQARGLPCGRQVQHGLGSEALAKSIEREYWRIVERSLDEEVSVEYGNDLDTGRIGSGFVKMPTPHPWDLNRINKSEASVLKRIAGAIPGVTHPWLYFGMLFATFCWHTEDHYLCSINYNHHGAPKSWYGIPYSNLAKFEKMCHRAIPERFKADPNLLHQLITLVPPSQCVHEQVEVYRTLQEAGHFVITFPGAYHAGFSHGFNCAEAVNFGLLDWMPFGREALQNYRSRDPRRGKKRGAIFPHDLLAWELVSALLFDPRTEPATPTTIAHGPDPNLQQAQPAPPSPSLAHPPALASHPTPLATHPSINSTLVSDSKPECASSAAQSVLESHFASSAAAIALLTAACAPPVSTASGAPPGLQASAAPPGLPVVADWSTLMTMYHQTVGHAGDGISEAGPPGAGAGESGSAGAPSRPRQAPQTAITRRAAESIVQAVPQGGEILRKEALAVCRDELELRAYCRELKLKESAGELGAARREMGGYVCCYCDTMMYLSAVTCPCGPSSAFCLHHGAYEHKCPHRLEERTLWTTVSDRRISCAMAMMDEDGGEAFSRAVGGGVIEAGSKEDVGKGGMKVLARKSANGAVVRVEKKRPWGEDGEDGAGTRGGSGAGQKVARSGKNKKTSAVCEMCGKPPGRKGRMVHCMCCGWDFHEGCVGSVEDPSVWVCAQCLRFQH